LCSKGDVVMSCLYFSYYIEGRWTSGIIYKAKMVLMCKLINRADWFDDFLWRRLFVWYTIKREEMRVMVQHTVLWLIKSRYILAIASLLRWIWYLIRIWDINSILFVWVFSFVVNFYLIFLLRWYSMLVMQINFGGNNESLLNRIGDDAPL
jgi:hypothetical protein